MYLYHYLYGCIFEKFSHFFKKWSFWEFGNGGHSGYLFKECCWTQLLQHLTLRFALSFQSVFWQNSRQKIIEKTGIHFILPTSNCTMVRYFCHFFKLIFVHCAQFPNSKIHVWLIKRKFICPDLDILFASNRNIYKSFYGLRFWSSDPLIDRFC